MLVVPCVNEKQANVFPTGETAHYGTVGQWMKEGKSCHSAGSIHTPDQKVCQHLYSYALQAMQQ
jgi:hypothetical protein